MTYTTFPSTTTTGNVQNTAGTIGGLAGGVTGTPVNYNAVTGQHIGQHIGQSSGQYNGLFNNQFNGQYASPTSGQYGLPFAGQSPAWGAWNGLNQVGFNQIPFGYNIPQNIAPWAYTGQQFVGSPIGYTGGYNGLNSVTPFNAFNGVSVRTPAFSTTGFGGVSQFPSPVTNAWYGSTPVGTPFINSYNTGNIPTGNFNTPFNGWTNSYNTPFTGYTTPFNTYGSPFTPTSGWNGYSTGGIPSFNPFVNTVFGGQFNTPYGSQFSNFFNNQATSQYQTPVNTTWGNWNGQFNTPFNSVFGGYTGAYVPTLQNWQGYTGNVGVNSAFNTLGNTYGQYNNTLGQYGSPAFSQYSPTPFFGWQPQTTGHEFFGVPTGQFLGGQFPGSQPFNGQYVPFNGGYVPASCFTNIPGGFVNTNTFNGTVPTGTPTGVVPAGFTGVNGECIRQAA